MFRVPVLFRRWLASRQLTRSNPNRRLSVMAVPLSSPVSGSPIDPGGKSPVKVSARDRDLSNRDLEMKLESPSIPAAVPAAKVPSYAASGSGVGKVTRSRVRSRFRRRSQSRARARERALSSPPESFGGAKLISEPQASNPPSQLSASLPEAVNSVKSPAESDVAVVESCNLEVSDQLEEGEIEVLDNSERKENSICDQKEVGHSSEEDQIWFTKHSKHYRRALRQMSAWQASGGKGSPPKSAKYLTAGVSSRVSCSVVFVYARNTEAERRVLWRDLVAISRNSLVAASPLLVMGDFNQILTAGEHFSLLPYDLPVRGMEDFQSALEDGNLSDLDIRGSFFSWSNRRPEDQFLRKLDRVLCNEKWRDIFPDAVSVFEAPGESDHSPAVVSFSSQPQTRKCSFKYFSFLASHPSFKEEMLKAWEESIPVGSKMYSLGQRLKKAKATCRRLNKEGFGNIQQRASEALEALKAVQLQMLSSPSDSLFRQKFVAHKKWQFFESAQEIFFSRKARIRWLDCGDANTKFFYKAVVAHQMRNCVTYLMDGGGLRVFNMSQIKDMTVAFFHNLLGTVDDSVRDISVEELRGIECSGASD
ncbi:hypothetical protein HA466_0033230 [Hirschfeldia incana]|nr:hypothetical protein HA466_0033230 [Hirschfeldia incana]